MIRSPKQIAETYIETGRAKSELSAGRMLAGGIFAGVFIAFGALGSQIASFSIETVSLSKLAGCLIFPIGLTMVLCAGAELFTGNNLIVLSVLTKKTTVQKMLKNWLLVWAGNFLGSLLVAFLAVFSNLLSAEALQSAVLAAAQTKCLLPAGDCFLRGILCNILVCCAVWISIAADEQAGKIIGLYLPTALFVLCGFEHCVANMFFIPEAMMLAARYGLETSLSFGGMLHNLLFVTLGNIAGGALLFSGGVYYLYLKQ